MKVKIVLTENEFHYCPDWPEIPIPQLIPGKLVWEDPEIPIKKYKDAIVSALKSSIKFADQKEAKFCVHCLMAATLGIFNWPPDEGDYWDCPFMVKIQNQLTEDGGKTWIECPEPTYNYYKKLTTTNVRQVAILPDKQ